LIQESEVRVNGVAEAAVTLTVCVPGVTVPEALWKESEVGEKVNGPVVPPEVVNTTGIEMGLSVIVLAALLAVAITVTEYRALLKPETFGVNVSWLPLCVTVSQEGEELTVRVVRALPSLARTVTGCALGVAALPFEVNTTVLVCPTSVVKLALATG